jgi:hypothetical protein
MVAARAAKIRIAIEAISVYHSRLGDQNGPAGNSTKQRIEKELDAMRRWTEGGRDPSDPVSPPNHKTGFVTEVAGAAKITRTWRGSVTAWKWCATPAGT